MKAARIGLPFFGRACSLLLEYAQGSRKAADKLENGQSGCGGSLAINRDYTHHAPSRRLLDASGHFAALLRDNSRTFKPIS